MNILVTGGLGYIGSHTVVELVRSGHSVVIVDNLINSKIEVLAKIADITGTDLPFYQIDATDEVELETVFSNHQLHGVINFAGFKAVGESVEKPLAYYQNNLLSTIVVSKLCIKYGISKIVFSSSATVYGDQPSPLKEDMPLKKTTNPYGETKVMSERILQDVAAANNNLAVILLRYFNPIGAHQSGLIGEDPNDIPNNLMPYVTKVASGELKQLSVFGDDYDTPDGTGVRDYIHVVDLAKGHVKALEQASDGVAIYNLGTGCGTSVLELVNTFIRINAVDVPYKIIGRRAGDVATCFADVCKAERELGWKAELTIEDMVRDAWQFVVNN